MGKLMSDEAVLKDDSCIDKAKNSAKGARGAKYHQPPATLDGKAMSPGAETNGTKDSKERAE